MTGDLWHRLAGDVERLDSIAGRALHAVLRDRAAPLRIQVAGRAGTGFRSVRDAVRVSVGAGSTVEVAGVAVDVPDTADPVFDGDVVVYAVPVRLDPASVHPADRSSLSHIDARRVVVVVVGGTDEHVDPIAATLGLGAFAVGDPALTDAIAARLAAASRLRDEHLVRVVAGIAATPAARDLIEAALDAANLSRRVS